MVRQRSHQWRTRVQVLRIVKLAASGAGWTDSAKKNRNRVFLAYAREYRLAAVQTGSPLVRAQLLGHALELLLKTYLLSEGSGERKLRRLGHRLTQALAQGRTFGLDNLLTISPETEAALRELDAIYAADALRYFSILFFVAPPRVPNLRRLFRLAEQLDRKLEARL